MQLLALWLVPLLASVQAPSPAPVPLGESATFPLVHTHLDAEVVGPLAQVTVVQTFANEHPQPIEVIYTFPLPADAAVDAFRIHTGGRTIRGSVVEREEAARIYEDARQQGWLAARLDQERPNVFIQRVANVLPGEAVEVELRFATTATWREGEFELSIPLVVGHRYHSGRPRGTRRGEGTAPDTTLVPDGSLLSLPLLPERTPPPLASLRLHVEAGVPLDTIDSPSHSLLIERTGSTTFEVAADGVLPNQDFVLRWAPKVRAPEVSLIAHRTDEVGSFVVQVLPPPAQVRGTPAAREIVLLLDTSGSMYGHPIQTATAVARAVLEHLDPRDTFQIIDFSQHASSLSPSPLAATRANIGRGIAHLEALQGGGGTEMLPGIRAALAPPADPRRMRIVLLLTDGGIGYEHHVLGEVRQLLGEARLFALGVGTSTNRFLLDELAAEGRGAVDYVRPDEDTDEVAARFRRRIEQPVLTDLVLEGPGLRDLQPRRIPDLFAGQPLTIFGRYDGHGPTDLVLRGKANGRSWVRRLRVDLPAREDRFGVLAAAWARAEIAERIRENWLQPREETVEAITRLALAHQIVTDWTSFVAVEEGRRTGDEAMPIVQPVLVPAGVDRRMVRSAGLLELRAGARGQAHGVGGLGTRGGSGLGLGGLGTRGGGMGSPLGPGGLGSSANQAVNGLKAGRRIERLSLVHVEGQEADREAIEKLVTRDFEALHRCHAQARPRATRLRLRITISEAGGVRLERSGSTRLDGFERCVAGLIAGWPVALSGAEATVVLRVER